LAFGQVGEKN